MNRVKDFRSYDFKESPNTKKQARKLAAEVVILYCLCIFLLFIAGDWLRMVREALGEQA